MSPLSLDYVLSVILNRVSFFLKNMENWRVEIDRELYFSEKLFLSLKSLLNLITTKFIYVFKIAWSTHISCRKRREDAALSSTLWYVNTATPSVDGTGAFELQISRGTNGFLCSLLWSVPTTFHWKKSSSLDFLDVTGFHSSTITSL